MTTLFTPTQTGTIQVPNRIFMAPLTRSRAEDDTDVPSELAAEYYAQRASAGLIISEATQINREGKGYIRTPGIYSGEQVAKWRDITRVVHENDGKIFLQLWHVGRISHHFFQPDGQAPLAPSAVTPEVEVFFDGEKRPASEPRAMTQADIERTLQDYRRAAENAREAGFDGVEIHAANGYLIDQFLRDKTNQRTDEWGGSVENRCRFLSRVIDEVLSVWPAAQVGIRLSPLGTQNDIADSDPLALFSHVIDLLNSKGFAYLHMVERFPGIETDNDALSIIKALRERWQGFYIANGEYDYLRASQAIESGYADAVAFGRPFIANPDLPARMKAGVALNEPDTDTFYAGEAHGYIDYPFMEETG